MTLVSYLHCCRNNNLDSTPKVIVWVNLATTSIKKDLESFNSLQLDAIQYHPSVAISVYKSPILPNVCIINVAISRVHPSLRI